MNSRFRNSWMIVFSQQMGKCLKLKSCPQCRVISPDRAMRCLYAVKKHLSNINQTYQLKMLQG